MKRGLMIGGIVLIALIIFFIILSSLPWETTGEATSNFYGPYKIYEGTQKIAKIKKEVYRMNVDVFNSSLANLQILGYENTTIKQKGEIINVNLLNGAYYDKIFKNPKNLTIKVKDIYYNNKKDYVTISLSPN